MDTCATAFDFCNEIDINDKGIMLGVCYNRTNIILKAEANKIDRQSTKDELKNIFNKSISPLLDKYNYQKEAGDFTDKFINF